MRHLPLTKMAEDRDLLDAVQRLYAAVDNLSNNDDTLDAWIAREENEDLADGEKEIEAGFRSQRRRREVQSDEELKAELERDFLNPSPRFSIPWLNKLQQYVPFSQIFSFLFFFFLFSTRKF